MNSAALFPVIGPTEGRRYIGFGRARAATRRARAQNNFTTGGSLAAKERRGDCRNQGVDGCARAEAAGGDSLSVSAE